MIPDARGLARCRDRDRGDQGAASLELVGLLPLVVLAATAALQVAGILWAATSTDEAVRQGVRAESLGQDGCAAARANLPAAITIDSCASSGGSLGGGNDINLVVGIPMITSAIPLVPDVQITRAAHLP